MRTSLFSALLLTGTLFAVEHMNVSVCNLGQLPETSVKRAEEETAAVPIWPSFLSATGSGFRLYQIFPEPGV